MRLLLVLAFLWALVCPGSYADVCLTAQEWNELQQAYQTLRQELPRLRLLNTQLQATVEKLSQQLGISETALTSSTALLDGLETYWKQYSAAKEAEIWIYRGVIVIAAGVIIYMAVSN
jgi:hypothetical protein